MADTDIRVRHQATSIADADSHEGMLSRSSSADSWHGDASQGHTLTFAMEVSGATGDVAPVDESFHLHPVAIELLARRVERSL